MAKATQPVLVKDPVSGQIKALNLSDVSAMPLAQYYALAGQFVNVENAVYYDTAVFTAGTAITPSAEQRLFSRGKAQASSVANTGVAIPKKGSFLTNMIGDGEFEGGTAFILEQIAVSYMLTSEQPTTLGVRGEITAPNYTASVVISAANHAKAIGTQFEIQYVRNEETKLRGLVDHFPSPFIKSGAFGSPNAGYIQNGYAPTWNLLARPKVLESEDNFGVIVSPNVDTWTPTISFNLRVELIGKVIKTFIP